MPFNDTSLFGDAPLYPEDSGSILDELRKVRSERKAALNVPVAVEAEPKEYAEASQASKESGLPAEIIRSDKATYLRTVRQREILEALDSSPVLREKFSDPNFAAMSANDMKTLAEVERAAGVGIGGDPNRAFRELRYRARQAFAAKIGQPEPSVGSWVHGVADVVPSLPRVGVASLMAISADLLRPIGVSESFTSTLQGMADTIHEDEKIRRIATTPKFESDTARYIFEGTKSAMQFVFNVAVTGGNFPAALGLMGAETTAAAYPEYKGRGATTVEALIGSFTEGGIEVLTERIPLGYALSRFGKVGWKAFAAGLLGREIPTEQLATFLQDATSTAIANPNKTWGDFWAERNEAAYATLVATITQAGLIGGAGAGVHALAKRYVDSSDTLYTAETLSALSTLAEASELANIAPEEFESLVEAAAEKGELGTLYVVPEDLEDALEQAGIALDTLPDNIQEQFLSAAAATGPTIEIPLGTYLAQMSKTPLGKALKPHLRRAPGSMSQAEAQSFLENKAGELEQAANRIIKEQTDAGAARKEADAVKKFYVEQLTKTGRFTKDVNNMYAALMRDFYVSMAARVGVTPTELLELYQVHVSRTAPTGEAELKQLAKLDLSTAIKTKDGNITKGKPGQMHALLAEEKGLLNVPDAIMGFVDAEGTFYTRGEAMTKFKVQESADVAPLLQEKGKPPRGGISLPGGEVPAGQPVNMTLLEDADLSTFLHESGHFFFGVMSDLAGREDAPADVVADVNATLKWLGVRDLATWKKLPLEKKRKYHEKFAEGFEKYLFEGKAPNIEMQTMFAKFRQWLLQVYRTLDVLNVELSDEVRGVFGRMLASENTLRTAEEEKSFELLFDNAVDFAQPEGEFDKYIKLPVDAKDAAVSVLEKRSLRNMKWMRDARGRVLRIMQKDTRGIRKGVREEAADDVLSSPLYRAYAFLRNGKGLEIEAGVSHRLDVNALKDIDPAVWDNPEFRKRFTVKTKPGMHPDEVAEEFGLTSGEELVRFLAVIDPPKVAVEAATDILMIERYGDLVDKDQVERAADSAIHNEFRARAIRMELKALADLTKAPKYNVTRRMAKAAAARVVETKKLSELKPSTYTINAARLSREAKQALGKGDLETAALRKREQLVSFYVAKEMERVKAKTEKERKAMLRYDLRKVRKTLEAKDLVQIDALLDRYGLRAMSQRELAEKEALGEWLADLEKQDIQPEVADWLRNELRRQHYTTMTVEEFLGLADTIKNMAHVARNKRKSFLIARGMRLDTLAANAAASIIDNARKTIPERRSGLEQGPISKLSAWSKGFRKEHRNFASLMREMDGDKDDGVLWNTFLRSMNTQSDYETEANSKATIALSKIFAPVFKGDKLSKQTLIPAVGKSFTREERIGIALNVGNEINKERVLTGEEWSEAQLQAVVDTLTKAEMDMVQAIWDYKGSFRAEIAKKELRVKGIEPVWVEATPVHTRHGTYRGGYYTIRYDPVRDRKAQADLEADVARQTRRGFVTHTYTRQGHLDARKESTGRKLRYDFMNTVTQHVGQVIHDLAWNEWLLDAGRMLRDPAFGDAVIKHYGPDVLKELDGQIDAVAVGYVPAQTWAGRSLAHIRKGATVVGLGFRVTTGMIQFLGITQGMVRVGPKWVAEGLGQWLGSVAKREKVYTQIKAESSFMRMRPMNQMREMTELRSKVRAVSQLKQFAEDTMFYFIVKMQITADVPIYLGAKNKAYAQPGMTEDKAIASAEQAVRDTQGSGNVADLATIQRKSEGMKLWTNFMSFFVRTYNVTAERTSATDFAKPAQVAALMVDYLLLYTIPASLSYALYAAMKGGDQEPEELMWGLITANITYMMGGMILLRDVASAFEGFEFRGPTGTRAILESSKLIAQIAQGDMDMQLVKAFLATGGTLFHVPTGQFITTLDGMVALMEGETDSPFALIAGKPKK